MRHHLKAGSGTFIAKNYLVRWLFGPADGERDSVRHACGRCVRLEVCRGLRRPRDKECRRDHSHAFVMGVCTVGG